jgi:hypothetical protein
MKKIILSMILTTFLINMTIAQQEVNTNEDVLDLRDKVTLGFKGGVNFSNVYDSNQEDFNTDTKLGFVGGMFLALPLGKVIGIQPEVLYSQRGYKETGSLFNSKFTRTTNYLDVPLLLAIKPGPVLSILAGPQFSFLLDGKYDFESNILSGGVKQDFDNEDVRKNTLCLTGGLDLNFDNLVFSGRAGWDLKENNKDGSSITPRYKNVWLQATVGFRF